MLIKNGDLTLSTNWGSGTKHVVLVSGNLIITANQQVPVGSYLHFIVGGGITIGPQVTSLQGVYSSDGAIVIESSNNPFEASGTVVSLSPNGIISKRSLPGGDNATQASTVFTYRPDLVVNAPNEIRHKRRVWSEVSN
jgi:acetyltransferase-like isoleucine patch superfamily enzyme